MRQPQAANAGSISDPWTAVFTLGVVYLAGFQLADCRVGEAKTDLEQVVIPIRLFCETHCFHSEPLTQAVSKRILERPPQVIELRAQFLRCCSAGKHFLDRADSLTYPDIKPPE